MSYLRNHPNVGNERTEQRREDYYRGKAAAHIDDDTKLNLLDELGDIVSADNMEKRTRGVLVTWEGVDEIVRRINRIIESTGLPENEP